MGRIIRPGVIVISLLLMVTPPPAAAQEETPTITPDPGSVAIVSPAEGDLLSGTVQIVGTALHPSFSAFIVEYAVDPPVGESPWTPIQAPVAQQVRESTLAIWDTSDIPDNRYVIRLRVELTDPDLQAITTSVTITVSNATPTPLPTLFIPPTADSIQPTSGPTATPFIEMPPTRTPRPSPTPGGPTPTPDAFTLEGSPLDPNRLQQAAWRGATVTFVVFAGIGGYILLRGGVRRQLRIIAYEVRQWINRLRRR